jgi:hypothetical protein
MNRLTPILHGLAAATLVSLPLTTGACLSAEMEGNDIVLTAREGGCGFVDSIRLKGREVVRAQPGFVGAFISLVRAVDGTADSPFSNAVVAVLPAKLTSVEVGQGDLAQQGAYTDGKISIPFVRAIGFEPDARTVGVQEIADFRKVPADYLVAEHRLALPLVVCQDEHLRMIALGGAKRSELFRMDMNDVPHRAQNISAPRGHQPYWDIGAVLQLTTGHHLWKANHADTPVYPLESGEGAPGWADYSELDWGVTMQVVDPEEVAPWQLLIDARRGIFAIQPHPPSELPVSGADLGRRGFSCTLALHDASWPTTYPCELDFELYKRFLDWLNTPNSRWTPLNIVATWGIGLPVPDGTRTPQEMETIYRRIIFMERLQPSTLLRLLYRGDAYLMQGFMRDVVGKSTPRNQPMDQWEEDAKLFWEKVKRDGFPGKKGQ